MIFWLVLVGTRKKKRESSNTCFNIIAQFSDRIQRFWKKKGQKKWKKGERTTTTRRELNNKQLHIQRDTHTKRHRDRDCICFVGSSFTCTSISSPDL
jgi:hypothetical protein